MVYTQITQGPLLDGALGQLLHDLMDSKIVVFLILGCLTEFMMEQFSRLCAFWSEQWMLWVLVLQ